MNKWEVLKIHKEYEEARAAFKWHSGNEKHIELSKLLIKIDKLKEKIRESKEADEKKLKKKLEIIGLERQATYQMKQASV